MKPNLLSLGAGLLVGIVYNLLVVKSPAPPMIALIGLFGILLGEQVVPVARRVIGGEATVQAVKTACTVPVLGRRRLQCHCPGCR